MFLMIGLWRSWFEIDLNHADLQLANWEAIWKAFSPARCV